MNDVINYMVCEMLFIQVWIYNGWLDKLVSDVQLQVVWDLMKMGLIFVNCLLVCIVFVCSVEGKEKFCLMFFSGNLQKIMQVLVIVIVVWDSVFYDWLLILFFYGDVCSWFIFSLQLVEEIVFCNSFLQVVYLIFVCWVLGFDIGLMFGFDWEKVDVVFFVDNGWKSNLLVNIGYGDFGKLYGCLLCLFFDEVCLLV